MPHTGYGRSGGRCATITLKLERRENSSAGTATARAECPGLKRGRWRLTSMLAFLLHLLHLVMSSCIVPTSLLFRWWWLPCSITWQYAVPPNMAGLGWACEDLAEV